ACADSIFKERRACTQHIRLTFYLRGSSSRFDATSFRAGSIKGAPNAAKVKERRLDDTKDLRHLTEVA
ncbi:MAG: hypothetical protein ACXWIU_08375, partial [Limisphaerales bacterium]